MRKSITVKHGDTLTEIAERELGSWRRFYEIAIINRNTILNHPCHRSCMKLRPHSDWFDWIFPGQVLLLDAPGARS